MDVTPAAWAENSTSIFQAGKAHSFTLLSRSWQTSHIRFCHHMFRPAGAYPKHNQEKQNRKAKSIHSNRYNLCSWTLGYHKELIRLWTIDC
jgi:hypothetical protein